MGRVFGIVWSLLAGISYCQAATIVMNDLSGTLAGNVRHIHLSGPIADGDYEALKAVIGTVTYDRDLQFTVTLNSPGGSLAEALSIADYLRSLPAKVTTDVLQSAGRPADCASACVIVYLAGHYRFLGEGSRLGVHQFSSDDDEVMLKSEAVSEAQHVASLVSEQIRKSRASAEFFSLMSRVSPQDIHWVDRKILEDLFVVTGPIDEQKIEFELVNGTYYLRLWQQSLYGENRLIMTCNRPERTIVFASFVQPPDVNDFNSKEFEFRVMADGYPLEPQVLRPIRTDAQFVVSMFTLPEKDLGSLAGARRIAVRHVAGNEAFLGVEFRSGEDRVRNLITDCTGVTATLPSLRPGSPLVDPAISPGEVAVMFSLAAAPAAPAAESSQIQKAPAEPIILQDIDIVGHDYDTRGIRGIPIEACVHLCMTDRPGCRGVSYVVESRWCWPKKGYNPNRPKAGILSIVIPR